MQKAKVRPLNIKEQVKILTQTMEEVVDDWKSCKKRSFNRIPYKNGHFIISTLSVDNFTLTYHHELLPEQVIKFNLVNYDCQCKQLLILIDGLLDY